MKSNNFHAWSKKIFKSKLIHLLTLSFSNCRIYQGISQLFEKGCFFVVFDEIFKKLTYIAYLYQFFALFEICYDFWILESRIPGFQKSPGIGHFWLISIYKVYFPFNFSQGTWFSMQNLKITSFLEVSRAISRVPGNFWKFPGMM